MKKKKKAMELGGLYGFVLMLVLVGMIIGVGVLVLDKMSTAVYLDKNSTNESFTTTSNSSYVQLLHTNITKFLGVKNATGYVFNGSNYILGKTNGTIWIFAENKSTTCRVGQTCYANYEYRDYGTTATETLNYSRDAITPIASTWLTLIVTIVVLAIILTIVIRSFAVRRQ